MTVGVGHVLAAAGADLGRVIGLGLEPVLAAAAAVVVVVAAAAVAVAAAAGFAPAAAVR